MRARASARAARTAGEAPAPAGKSEDGGDDGAR